MKTVNSFHHSYHCFPVQFIQGPLNLHQKLCHCCQARATQIHTHIHTHKYSCTHVGMQTRTHSPCKVFWFCNASVKRWQAELFWRSPCFLRSWWTQRQIQILFYLGVMQFSVERTIQSWHWFENDHDPETNVETVFALYFLIMSVVFLDMLTAHL